jgi:beta-glucanase (GH16 family)
VPNASPIWTRGRIAIACCLVLLALALVSVAFAVDDGHQAARHQAWDGRKLVRPADRAQPAAIAGQGYRKVFADEFAKLNRAVWDNHVWYDERPHANWSKFQTIEAGGILHLRTSRNYIWHNNGQSGGYPMNTITTRTSRKRFKYGYFEARMKWTKGNGAWPGFWLYSYQHAIDQDQCKTRAGEIDVMEGQGSEPRVFYGTVHSNTNGCSPADDQNGNNYQQVATNLTAGFHSYGVKWTPTRVTWFLDGRRTHSARPYPADNQPMFLLLQMWSGGWTKEPDATTPDMLETQVDWVRVWQKSK